MALFTFWHDMAMRAGGIDQVHDLLKAEAHIVPDLVRRARIETMGGAWHLAAFATTTGFYSPDDQIWIAPDGGACVIHGLLCRMDGDVARLLDAREVAGLLDRPEAVLPDDIGGEYAVARLHANGTLTGFSDRAGLHQLFHGTADRPVLSNRAGMIATLLDDWRVDPAGLRWLPAIGYRVGTATSYRAAEQVGQGEVVRLAPGRIDRREMPDPIVDLAGPRGFSPALSDHLDEGIAQAKAALLLAVPDDGPFELPITGGKDSRVILALALAAGLRDRLSLFTRGYAAHPDVIAGAAIAQALGLPHRREAPHGSDDAAHWTRERFFDRLAVQAYQTDGLVGGWDLILGERIAAETLVSGHIGEVLKAYSKKPLPPGPIDPIAMIRLQAPFDPMAMLRPATRDAMAAEVGDAMARDRAAGAEEADLPDLFYLRNRLPNWLGAIRGIKSFERQPVVPLGAPALVRLAFRLTPDERRRELLHYLIVQRCAPELLALPFALQRWDAELADDVPQVDPILAQTGAPPSFGNWQYSLNHNPAIRAALAAEIAAHDDLGLWDMIDRDTVFDRLRGTRFDYFDGISMLGLTAAFLHEARLVRPIGMGAPDRFERPVARPLADFGVWPDPVIEGHLDATHADGDMLHLHGWAAARDWPAAQVALAISVDERRVGAGVANGERPDLIPHGLGDGRHGFAIAVPAVAGDRLVVRPVEGDMVIGVARPDGAS